MYYQSLIEKEFTPVEFCCTYWVSSIVGDWPNKRGSPTWFLYRCGGTTRVKECVSLMEGKETGEGGVGKGNQTSLDESSGRHGGKEVGSNEQRRNP